MERSNDALIEYKKPHVEDIIGEIKSIISLQNIELSLERIVLIIKEYHNEFPELRTYLNQLILPQWREESVTLKKKPHIIRAVGPLVAWIYKKAKKCHYYNLKTKKNHTINFKKKIRFLDLSPNATKLAVATVKKVVIWHCRKNREAASYDCDNTISALNYYKHTGLLVGFKNGSLLRIHYKKKNSISVSELPTGCNNPLIALAAFENLVIAQDSTGSVKGYHKISRKKNLVIDYGIKVNQLATIIPFGICNWVASDVQGKCYTYEQVSPVKKNLYSNNIGTLICGTPYMAYVLFQANSTDRSLKYFSSKDELLEEVIVLPDADPVVQKPWVSASINQGEWIPIYLVYKNNKINKWELLSKRIPTMQQLAFQLILAKAYEQRNLEALEVLFSHPQFKIFGQSYTRKLLLSFYNPKKFCIKLEKKSLNQLYCELLSK